MPWKKSLFTNINCSEEPPPLPKKIRSCCLYKYPEWVQGMVGSEAKQPAQHLPQMYHSHQAGASGLNTTITSGRPPLPHSIREAQQHSAALQMNTAPMQLDPGSLSDVTRPPPTWREMRSQSAGGATNSLLKKAIANRLKPSISADKNRPPTERSQANETGASPLSEGDPNAINDFSARDFDMDPSAKKDDVKIKKDDPKPKKDDVKIPTNDSDQHDTTSKTAEKSATSDQPNKSAEALRDRNAVPNRPASTDQIQSKRGAKMKTTEQSYGKANQQESAESPSRDSAEKIELDGSAEQRRESVELLPKGEPGKMNKKVAPAKEAQHRSPPTDRPRNGSVQKERSASPLTTSNPSAKRPSSQPIQSETSRNNLMALNIDPRHKRPRHRSKGVATDDIRRGSTMSESSRVSFSSHKSVTFSDRVQLHEIERNEMSSSEEDAAIMSDDELVKHPPVSRHRRASYPQQNEPEDEQLSDLCSPQDDDQMIFGTLRQSMMLPRDEVVESDDYAAGYPPISPAEQRGFESRGSQISNCDLEQNRSPMLFPQHTRFPETRSTGVQATEMFTGSYPQFYPHMGTNIGMDVHTFPRSASGYFEEDDSDEEETRHSYVQMYYPGEREHAPGDSPLFFSGRGPVAGHYMGIPTYDNSPSPIPGDDDDRSRNEPSQQLQTGQLSFSVSHSEHTTPRSGTPDQTTPTPQHIVQPRTNLGVQMIGNVRRDERGDIEDEMRRQFLARFGAGRRAPVAEEDPCDPVHPMEPSDSISFSSSRESVVSAASIAKEAFTHRHFDY